MQSLLRRLITLACALGALGLGAAGRLTAASPTTILYESRLSPLPEAIVEGEELLIPAAAVTRVTGFELKPAGACRAELCIPLSRSSALDVLMDRDGQSWFSLTAFARRLDQPVVHDAETGTWSFGEIPLVSQAGFSAGVAPDFTLPDRQGKPVRLADFRGKKVLILSWASW